MTEREKIQWHPGFVAAMDLEFAANRKDLEYEKEYNLNTKPLEVDLLVIKKDPGVQITNEIGKHFLGHNLMEYKAPGDELDIDTFYKVMSYAGLYKSYGRTLDERKADDITVSFLRESKPRGLLQYLEGHGETITNTQKGIYYITGHVPFKTQIVVTGELDRREHIWLGSLSKRLRKQDLEELLGRIRELKGKEEKEMADSVLEVSIGANRGAMEELIGDESMYETLMEMMEPRLQVIFQERENAGIQKGMRQGMQQGIQQGMQQGIQQGMQQGMRQGIKGTVDILRELGHGDEEIKIRIMEKYDLKEEAAEEYL